MTTQEVINKLTAIYRCFVSLRSEGHRYYFMRDEYQEALATAIWELKFKIPKYRKEAKRWKRKYLMLKMEVENGERDNSYKP